MTAIGDTIVAPVTPPGHGGVSMIRVSGPRSKSVSKKITGLNLLENRRSALAAIWDESVKIDDVIVTFFKNPFSYTGEDIVEVACHGNPFVVDRILNLYYKNGVRLAEPGEFTKRAFLNGKLDLVQAESVSSIIGARSAAALELNQKILSGFLSDRILKMKESLLGVVAELEFELDVSDEDLMLPDLVERSLIALNNNMLCCAALVGSFKEGSMYNYGSRVVIYGSPNVGKSTLLNALLDKDRAITDPSPGTTRDTVEAQIMLGGIPVTLVDTAGVRETKIPVEADGVLRSVDEAASADLLLRVFDTDSYFNADEYLVDNIKNKQSLIIRNKCDLSGSKRNLDNVFYVSALLGRGIADLKLAIKKRLIDLNCIGSDVVLTTRRQVDSISSCEQSIRRAISQLQNEHPELEIVSFETRDAIRSLGRLVGDATVDEVLDKIFSDFCVGK